MEEQVIETKKKLPSFFSWFQRNLMQTTNGMAIGLFGTLILGTILDLFTRIPHFEALKSFTTVLKGLMGAGIGLGVFLSKKKSGVAAVTGMASGAIGNYMFHWLNTAGEGNPSDQFLVLSIGDPLSCYCASIFALLTIHYLLRKKTAFDILLVPLTGILAALFYSFFFANWVHYVTIGLGLLIEVSFSAVPALMCIILSALVGMALTAPISSVALCVAVSIGNVPLAAASALIGCSTQMLGFALETKYDNKWGDVLAVGLGTSMLQFKNILRKPLIWLPTIIASALLGPLAMLLPIPDIPSSSVSSLSVAAGMGTSGLVGPLNYLSATGYGAKNVLLVLIFTIVLPLLLVFLIDLLFRKKGILKKGDFALSRDL